MLYVIAPWWGWKIAYKNKIVEWVYRAQFQNATASNSIVLSLALMYGECLRLRGPFSNLQHEFYH